MVKSLGITSTDLTTESKTREVEVKEIRQVIVDPHNQGKKIYSKFIPKTIDDFKKDSWYYVKWICEDADCVKQVEGPHMHKFKAVIIRLAVQLQDLSNPPKTSNRNKFPNMRNKHNETSPTSTTSSDFTDNAMDDYEEAPTMPLRRTFRNILEQHKKNDFLHKRPKLVPESDNQIKPSQKSSTNVSPVLNLSTQIFNQSNSSNTPTSDQMTPNLSSLKRKMRLIESSSSGKSNQSHFTDTIGSALTTPRSHTLKMSKVLRTKNQNCLPLHGLQERINQVYGDHENHGNHGNDDQENIINHVGIGQVNKRHDTENPVNQSQQNFRNVNQRNPANNVQQANKSRSCFMMKKKFRKLASKPKYVLDKNGLKRHDLYEKGRYLGLDVFVDETAWIAQQR
ncbi:hypothetical protein TKK_0015592 [Trichogramma kaykai]|uniref:Uncharacterized protein n=1 Tax=Trichogramma kaykai TaxID=54128 RepID=A0ABD2WAH2_9HYME